MFNNKSILITGGTGSFGHKCTEMLLKKFSPKRVIIYSRDEFKQYEMARKFSAKEFPCMRYFIGDVRDKERLYRAFKGVDYVIHAAAMKQVPASEYNPFEAIKTNVLGAQNIINTAIDVGVKKVIALSTDKAVSPANLYGATKLCSDKLFVAGNLYAGAGETQFSVVRYGNVVGSRGSVIPLFLKQKETGTLTITDPRMTRFWITLEQSVNFVLDGFERMVGGEIFVQKIPSMNMVDLAKAMGPDCEIKHIGIRPGEKLHEVMISADDSRNTSEFDNYYVIKPDSEFMKTKYNQIGGKPVQEEFVYSSDKNTEWIDGEDLLKMISTLQIEK
ncbi:UDP-N-acetylglucosamine 4,6-dehydratase (inverting) [Maridesulfovibrio ferrireducens]|uniref:UDP-N-acetylglucosamine 4,6-dehydratase (inverting) n=1 Tax=Maridesulfovibrio ferrireducens TaxID=246191 RepID=UPI001A2D00CA|nr:UDP-N-acetylglucosamine 4,6-dehydratase (inverting) [Maridesulfovibrio ferrireducens]MBI9112686.1 UDP-N-acetylglucosamine 4,6-dehydratase (inverting) [Maridesulfovibrio ferrireducens]